MERTREEIDEPLSPAEQSVRGRAWGALAGGAYVALITFLTCVRIAAGPVDGSAIFLWLTSLFVSVLLVVVPPLGTHTGLGPRWFDGEERAIVNDELTRANRRIAFACAAAILAPAMLAAALAALGWFALPRWWPVASLGIGLAVMSGMFGRQELRGQ